MVQQTVQQPTQPAQTQQPAQQPVAQIPPKKSIFTRWWFWLIIVLVLAGIGTGLYFWLF